MKRFIGLITLLVLFSLTPALPVRAQNGVIIDQMMIEVWPEFDRPDVLVIYHITLDTSVSLPVQVSLLIPRTAGDPYNVAMKDVDGLLYNLAYTTEVQNDFQKVTFTTPTAGVQIEYYDPGMTRDGTTRKFTFEWTADYEVKDLSITIQQPVNASDMQIIPSFGAGDVASNGLTYFTNNIGPVDAGRHITVGFNYTKPDDQLSNSLQSVETAEPVNAATPGKTNPIDILPWVLGGVGMVFLVGGFGWFMLTKNKTNAANASRRRHRTVPTHRPSPRQEAASGDAAIYCHQCGRRAAPGDVFCRTCGTKLRAE